MSLKRNMELTCDGCGVKKHIDSMDFAESGQVLEDFIADALLGAVDRLPPKQRQVVAYRYLADLSYA